MKTSNEYAIVTEGLRKSFGKVVVLDGIDLKVKRGTILAMLGPNGAGKTTTVRILSTLLQADSGSAHIEDFDVQHQADDVRGIIGLTGQYAAIDEYLTGRENLHMMGRLYHLSGANAKRRSDELLVQFDLVDAADRPAKTYSGGMRRRLDLAVSLIAAPPIIFLDEPTTGLDPRSRMTMWSIIKQLVRDGATILLTTQYLEEADQLADQIVVIDGGKIIAQGTADQLKDQVGKERAEFTFGTAAELSKAKKAIGDKGAQIDEQKLSLSVANEGGVGKLKHLIEQLEKANVAVEGLSLHKPTLDDVFMHVTGHAAELAEDEEQLAKKGKK